MKTTLRRILRYSVLAFSALWLTAAPPPPLLDPSMPGLDSEESAFLTLINNLRAQHGAGPLQVSAALENSSRWMSNDMATKNYASHTDSLGRDAHTRMVSFHYVYGTWGENIAAGSPDAQRTLNDLETACDPDTYGQCTYGHRKNMLNPNFKVIGIGRAHKAGSAYGGWYWTTDFGGEVDQTISSTVGSTTGSGVSESLRRRR